MLANPVLPIPRWFWFVSGTGLVWTVIGVMTYIMTVTTSPDTMASLPDAERALMESLPSFVIGAYAIAVFAGTLGCVALLLQKRWAILLFGLSLIAILIQMGYTLLISEHLKVYGPTGGVFPLVIISVAGFFLWFSRFAKSSGWLS